MNTSSPASFSRTSGAREAALAAESRPACCRLSFSLMPVVVGTTRYLPVDIAAVVVV